MVFRSHGKGRELVDAPRRSSALTHALPSPVIVSSLQVFTRHRMTAWASLRSATIALASAWREALRRLNRFRSVEGAYRQGHVVSCVMANTAAFRRRHSACGPGWAMSERPSESLPTMRRLPAFDWSWKAERAAVLFVAKCERRLSDVQGALFRCA